MKPSSGGSCLAPLFGSSKNDARPGGYRIATETRMVNNDGEGLSAQAARLKELCTEALERFTREAQKTCTMLTSMESFPAPPDQRQQFGLQRMIEYEAYVSYTEVRQQLVRFVFGD